MATEFSVQGSITVKRLRTGATLTLYLKQDGALQQFVNVDTGDVTPKWSEEANQPTVTPMCTASTGGTVTISATPPTQGWFYNSTLLTFDGSQGTTSQGWIIDTTGKFAQADDGSYALRIIDDLASTTNYASDTLEFVCLCTYEGAEYVMSAMVTINILQSGTSGYTGYLYADSKILSLDVTNTDIHAQLFNGVSYETGFYTKWYRNYRGSDVFKTAEAGSSTTATINVNRDEVNGGDNSTTSESNDQTGGTLFVCEFYKSSTDTTPVAVAGINIADEADEYSMIMTYVSDNKTLDTGKDVTVQADIYSLSQGQVITSQCNVTEWKLMVLNKDLEPMDGRTVNTQTITVTMDDVEDDNDVNVVGEATFTLNMY